MVFDLYNWLIYPIIFIFPAYVANALPVIFGRGSRTPLDFNKKFMGKRILGDHKTVRGTLSGLIGGILIGYLESLLGFGFMLPISVLMTIGALFGDVLGSFIKRRLNLKSGHSVPIMDQYGFFIFGLLFALPISFNYLPTWYGLLLIAVLTGVFHVISNIIAHRLKLKDVPW